MEREEAFKNLRIGKLILYYIMIGIATSITFFIIGNLAGIKFKDHFRDMIFSITFYLIPIIWMLVSFKKTGMKFSYITGDFPKKYRWWNIIPIVVILLVFSIGAMDILYYPISFISPAYIEDIFKDSDIVKSSQTSYYILFNAINFIIIVIVAPIVEEIFFRGILLHKLSLKKSIVSSVIISAIIFGIFHFDIIGGFVFAVIMSMLYIKTKSLIVPMACHILNNFVAVSGELIDNFTKVNKSVYTVAQFRSEIWTGVICCLITVPFIIWFVYKNYPKKSCTLPYFDNRC